MLFALRLRLRDMQRSIGSTGFLHGPVVSFLIESREAQTRKTASISHAHPSSSSKDKLSAFFEGSPCVSAAVKTQCTFSE